MKQQGLLETSESQGEEMRDLTAWPFRERGGGEVGGGVRRLWGGLGGGMGGVKGVGGGREDGVEGGWGGLRGVGMGGEGKWCGMGGLGGVGGCE